MRSFQTCSCRFETTDPSKTFHWPASYTDRQAKVVVHGEKGEGTVTKAHGVSLTYSEVSPETSANRSILNVVVGFRAVAHKDGMKWAPRPLLCTALYI